MLKLTPKENYEIYYPFIEAKISLRDSKKICLSLSACVQTSMESAHQRPNPRSQLIRNAELFLIG